MADSGAQQTHPQPSVEQKEHLALLKTEFDGIQSRSRMLRTKLRQTVSVLRSNVSFSIFSYSSYGGFLVQAVVACLLSEGWIIPTLGLYLLGVLLLCTEAIFDLVALSLEDAALRLDHDGLLASIRDLQALVPSENVGHRVVWWKTFFVQESESVPLLIAKSEMDSFCLELNRLFTAASWNLSIKYQYQIYVIYFSASVLFAVMADMVIPYLFVKAICKGGKILAKVSVDWEAAKFVS